MKRRILSMLLAALMLLSVLPTGTLSLRVKAEDVEPVEVRVCYYANDGTDEEDWDWATSGGNYTVLAPSFTRGGWNFLGWNTDPDGEGDAYPAGTVIENLPEGELNLYAQWERNSVTWSLEDGVLTVSGAGTMEDYCDLWGNDQTERRPWDEARDSITAVVIESGVTSVGAYAFSGCVNLASVTLPASVRTICQSAFYGCEAITSVALPEGLEEIARDAFGYTGLTAAVIPESVGEIDVRAFHASPLTSVTVAAENPTYKTTDGVLFSKDGTRLVASILPRIGEYTVPAGVETICSQAFAEQYELTAVILPESLEYIENSAFGYCSALTSVSIPAGVTEIQTQAFYGCSGLTDYTVADGNEDYLDKDGVLFSADGETLLCYPCGRTGAVTLPAGTSVGDYALTNCRASSVAIPEGYESIGAEAFSFCNQLVSVALPASLTGIADNAFYECGSLTTVTYGGTAEQRAAMEIADGNESLLNAAWLAPGQNAIVFSANGGEGSVAAILASAGDTVTLPENGFTYWDGDCSFTGWNTAADGSGTAYAPGDEIEMPEGGLVLYATWKYAEEVSVYYYANYGTGSNDRDYATSGESYTVRENSFTRGGWNFLGWNTAPDGSGIAYVAGTEIVLPEDGLNLYAQWEKNSVTWSLADGVLTVSGEGTMEDYYCNIEYPPWYDVRESINSVVIESGVTSVGANAFVDCVNLTSVTFPTSLRTIKDSAFSWCPSLTSITLPDGLNSIESAFNFTGLTEVTIPASVSEIDAVSFADSPLKSFTVDEENPTFKAADGVLFSKDGTRLVASIIPRIGEYIVPAGVETICYRAFENQDECTSVILPESLKRIEDCAFESCDSLTSISIPDGVTEINPYAFWLCSGLTEFTVFGGNENYTTKDGALFSADGKTLLYYPCGRTGAVTLPAGTTVGVNALTWCRASSITIPEGYVSISNDALESCNLLVIVTIPTSVAKISNYAFFNCDSLAVVTYGGTDEQRAAMEIADGNDALLNATWLMPGQNMINFNANGGAGSMDAVIVSTDESVTLPLNQFTNEAGTFAGWNTAANGSGTAYADGATINSVPAGGLILYAQWVPGGENWSLTNGILTVTGNGPMVDYAYGGAPWNTWEDMVTTIVISEGVTRVGAYAFASLSHLTSVSLANSVAAIGTGAFFDCQSLASVTIPMNVVSIENNAFGIQTEFIVDAANASYASVDGVLFTKDMKTLLQCPAGKTGAYVIPDNVTAIGDGAFSFCGSITSFTLPDTLVTIENRAFAACWGITSITIPASVESIGEAAFSACASLENVVILGNLTTISGGTFSACPLKTVTIPASVTEIETGAFTLFVEDPLTDVYYGGTTAQKANIQIDSSNSALLNAVWHCADTNREIVITAASDTKTYDGVALTNDGYTYTDGVLAEGDELTAVVEGSITDAGTAANVVTSYKVMRGSDDVTGNYTFGESVDGTLTVTKRSVTLTSADDTKVYDGTALTNDTITVSADGFVTGEGATYDVTGGQLDAGTSENEFTYELNEGTLTGNYEITTVFGSLTVTPITDKIVITAASDTKIYDGMALTNAGYTYTDGVLTEGDELTAVVEGTITNVGETVNEVVSYQIMRGSDDVTANYTFGESVDGVLAVEKRAVTLTSANDMKVYDGTALMNNAITVTGDGFADGEGTTYHVTGSQLDAGTSENEFTYELNVGTGAENYAITTAFGTLTVTPITDEIVITAASDTKTYDGRALTNDGYAYTEGVLVEGDVLTAVVEGIQTDAGTAANVVTSYRVMRGSDDVTANYTFGESVGGTLTVTKRSVTLTSASDSKTYDGTILTNDTVTVGGDGFADGEGAAYDVTGSQLDAGSSENTFTYTLNGNTKAGNYVVTKVYGTLVVGAAPIETVDEGEFGDGLHWTLDSAGTLTISGTGAMPDYQAARTAPWDTYVETNKVKTLVIAEGITYVGAWTFYRNLSLESVTLAASVEEIGQDAFGFTGMKHLPDLTHVKRIGMSAFIGNRSVEDSAIIIPEGVVEVGRTAFILVGADVGNVKNVTVPASLTNIGYSAFHIETLTGIAVNAENPSYKAVDGVLFTKDGTTLHTYPAAKGTAYVVPDGTSVIGESAFIDASINSVTIPVSVSTVGQSAFGGCSTLTDVYYGGTAANREEINFDRYNDDLLNAEWHFGAEPAVVASGSCGESLTWTLDEAGTLTISGTGAMTEYSTWDTNPAPWSAYNTDIMAVVIEEGVTSIGKAAFHDCEDLASVSMPDSLLSIGSEAFNWCMGLNEIRVPRGVTFISPDAFNFCNCKIIVDPENSAYVCENDVLFSKDHTTLVLYRAANSSYAIPSGVTAIGAGAFASGCVTNVTIPEGVTTIGANAFENCAGLTALVIPEGVTHIGRTAFMFCSNVRSVALPKSLSVIDESAFALCAPETVIYAGTAAQKNGIRIESGNESLTYATWTCARTGWVKTDGKRYYYLGSGEMATGWTDVDGKSYYLGTDGVMQTGWKQIGGRWYYFGTDGAKKTGWTEADGKTYYLGTDGVMQTGWKQIGGSWYYLNSEKKTGWAQVSGKWYYLGTDGVMRSGWQQIGGVWYYLGTDGAMRTGWQTVNGVKYYFDANGAMQVSWKQIGGVWYYFGTNGHMQTGWAQVGGKWYYLGTDGAMQTGWKQINAKWYYLSTDGAMRTGWQTVNGVKYYLGTDGAMRTGMQTVDGKKYYFGTSGALTTTAGWQSVNGSWYYRGTDGAMVTGWKQISGKWYYMDASTAIMSTNWKQVGGKWYYFSTDGAMRTGWQKIGTVWYFFGTSGAMQTGWYQESGKWYYFKTSGAMACSESVTIGAKTYQFNSSGVCTNP